MNFSKVKLLFNPKSQPRNEKRVQRRIHNFGKHHSKQTPEQILKVSSVKSSITKTNIRVYEWENEYFDDLGFFKCGKIFMILNFICKVEN